MEKWKITIVNWLENKYLPFNSPVMIYLLFLLTASFIKHKEFLELNWFIFLTYVQ